MTDSLPDNIGKRFGDLSSLPESLVQQIPAARVDDFERQILDVLKHQLDGVGTVDEILIGLYRLSGKVEDRTKLAGKLYRMASRQPQLLRTHEGRRGLYQIS